LQRFGGTHFSQTGHRDSLNFVFEKLKKIRISATLNLHMWHYIGAVHTIKKIENPLKLVEF
jgi:hypothetical protein